MRRLTMALTALAAACAVATSARAGGSATAATVTYGRPATVTLSLSPGLAADRVALAPWQPRIRAAIPLQHPADAVAVTKDAVLVAGDGGVTLYAAAGKPGTVLGRFAVHDTCTRLRVRGTIGFLACRRSGLWLLDVHDPRAPHPVGRIRVSHIRDFAPMGRYVAVLGNSSVAIYTIVDPNHPQATDHRRLVTPGHALAAGDADLVIAEGAQGVAVFHLDDHGRLTRRGRYVTTDPAVDVAVKGGLAYVALAGDGVVILAVTHAHRPRWVGSYHRLGGVRRLRVAGSRVYVAGADARVYGLDISRPERPSIHAARRFDAPVRDLAVTPAGEIWVLTNTAVERSDFSAPVPEYSNENFDVGEGVNFGGIRRGVIRGDVVYTADWFSGIHLFDIKDPTRPHLLSSLHIPGSAKGIVVKGNDAFVADDDHGLQVIDISNPFRPEVVAHLDTPGLAYVPTLDGDRLYLASHGAGFQIVDIRDPRHPRLLASQATPGRAWAVRVRGGIAYVADDAAGLLSFDVHDPKHIKPLGAFRPGGYAEDVVLHQGYALVAFFDQGLYLVDLSDPRRLTPMAHLDTPGNARGIDVRGDKAYLADWLAGVHIIDIADPRHPRILGGYDTDGAAWGVRVKGRYAYVMDWWGGFTVLDVANPARPRLAARYHDHGRVRQIMVRGTFIYVAYGRGGLQVFDNKTPLNPIWVTGLDVKGNAAALWIHTPYLYLASEGGGFTVVDGADPYHLTAMGHLALDLRKPLLVGDGRGYLYLYSRGTGIEVIDATHPDDPQPAAIIGTTANALWLAPPILYVATPRHGVQAYDVSDPARPTPLAMAPLPGPATAVTATGTTLYVAVAGKGLYTFQHRGKALKQLALFPLPRTIADMAVAGRHLLATAARGGLWDLTIAEDGRLHSTAFYPILHPSTRLSVQGATAYVAGGTTPTAVAWLPRLTVAAQQGGTVRLTLPKDLPRGAYSLLLLNNDGRGTLTPRVLSVRLPHQGGRPFTLQQFKKAYQAWRAAHPPEATVGRP